jgi:hypothetical protein
MEGQVNSKILIVVGVILLIAVVVAGGYLLLGNKSAPNTTPTATSSSSTQSGSSPTTGATQSAPPTISGDSILTADPAVIAEKSKKRFADAQSRLAAWSLWKTNAQFSGLFITFDQNLIVDSANEIYVFDSADDTSHHFTISVSQSTGNSLRALVPKSDYQGALLPIKTEFWQSNYADAVQFADKNGGSDFMKANDVISVDVNLLRTAPNDYLYWVVTYKTLDTSSYLTVKMDAKARTLAI